MKQQICCEILIVRICIWSQKKNRFLLFIPCYKGVYSVRWKAWVKMI